jgi:ABC-type lipoprotein export system ATPase subunit/ABC-type lipoprotein release transport system permease subunit
MITIKDLTKKYGDTTILNNASYTFPDTGLVCLMGASGGGKTTLLNLLAGFDTQYDGEITVGGVSLHSMDSSALCDYRKDNTGFVFQNFHLISGYTVLENIMLALELHDEEPSKNLQKITRLLEKLGIAGKINEKIENLSGGQKQRVAIARALVNEPQILFADEPTGSLDRATSTEIMKLLKSISKDRLVIIITHDQKVSEFADEVIHIKDKMIVSDGWLTNPSLANNTLTFKKPIKTSSFKRAGKNFKVHIIHYFAVSLAISIGMLAFLFSLSFGNIMEQNITDFKTKNTAFNNGYIKGMDDRTILDYLNSDPRIENVYYQYKLTDITLTHDKSSAYMEEKFPTAKAIEGLSYGVMPRIGKNEIAITPSLAKKFAADIKDLIGEQITLNANDGQYVLTVSGIYNAGYDDFLISSDTEQTLYTNITNQDNYSISYDVKEFEQIVPVSNLLKLKGIDSKNASDEVSALQSTFKSLNRLFQIISSLILGIGLFICIVLLVKLQNSRYREVGLLSALGFSRSRITTMILEENLFLSALATIVNLVLLTVTIPLSKITSFPFNLTGTQIVLCVSATFVVVMLVSFTASYKLIRTEPAEALRK